MEEKKADKIASLQMNEFKDEYLKRDQIANLLGVHYHTVPKILAEHGYEFGKSEQIRLHREVIKDILIKKHTGK